MQKTNYFPLHTMVLLCNFNSVVSSVPFPSSGSVLLTNLCKPDGIMMLIEAHSATQKFSRVELNLHWGT